MLSTPPKTAAATVVVEKRERKRREVGDSRHVAAGASGTPDYRARIAQANKRTLGSKGIPDTVFHLLGDRLAVGRRHFNRYPFFSIDSDTRRAVESDESILLSTRHKDSLVTMGFHQHLGASLHAAATASTAAASATAAIATTSATSTSATAASVGTREIDL
jgi:hypothetical protein